jgi:hypothetical protein
LEAERIRALGALCSLRSIKKLAAEKQRKTHFFSNKDRETWIEAYVERETAGARKRVEDTEAAVQQEQDNMAHAEIAELTSRQPEKTFEEMMAAIGDSLSDLARSDDGEDGEDEDEQTEQGKLSEDDEPGWVMGTISKMVQQPMESFRQKQMKVDELTQPGCVTVLERTTGLGDNARRFPVVSEELCYRKAEMSGDAEEATRWWQDITVR